jgi:hypothetical protein
MPELQPLVAGWVRFDPGEPSVGVTPPDVLSSALTDRSDCGMSAPGGPHCLPPGMTGSAPNDRVADSGSGRGRRRLSCGANALGCRWGQVVD